MGLTSVESPVTRGTVDPAVRPAYRAVVVARPRGPGPAPVPSTSVGLPVVNCSPAVTTPVTSSVTQDPVRPAPSPWTATVPVVRPVSASPALRPLPPVETPVASSSPVGLTPGNLHSSSITSLMFCLFPSAERCHRGNCPSCLQMRVKRCRCGAKSKEVQCAKTFSCETKCKSIRDCGRHPCNKKCCPGSCPQCEQACGKTLSCKNHKCMSRSGFKITHTIHMI